jgi:EAL domain-containing protein (putative c-di-GMP-specific phosphodiesterase class I)
VFLAVNVSAQTLVPPRLHDLLRNVRGRPRRLEVTEHSPLEDYKSLLTALGPLRRRGIGIAVDDTARRLRPRAP